MNTTFSLKSVRRGGVSLIGAVGALLLLCPDAWPETFTVKVNADGSFDPQIVFIHNGDSVMWEFTDKTIDSIIPVRTDLSLEQRPDVGICTNYKPYRRKGANEFTSPLPRTPSGIFTLGPDKSGLVERAGKDACRVCEKDKTIRAEIPSAGLCLCEEGQPLATMDSTWEDPEITGVFLRPLWRAVPRGPGEFFWDDLDREIDKAVKNGKLYSLAFKAGSQGTPEWIFRSQGGGSVVERLHFQDGGSKLEPGECGPEEGMDLGSPADANYRKYYFELLRAVAAHLKEKNAWYRALAYIKPSGMNLVTSENRLPNSCEDGCLCNPKVWATEGSYTPTALKEFYKEQMQLLTDEFPDKDMSYALIQAGFPLVNDAGEYIGQHGVQPWTSAQVPEDKCIFPNPSKVKEDRGILPNGTQQTECILQVGKENHGTRFAVQHNGLGPWCPDGADENAAGECLPNKWAKRAGKDGLIGYQTNNAQKVGSPEQLEAALQNGYCHSEATLFEIYEERLWELRKKRRHGVLDPNAGASLGSCTFAPAANRTIADWAQMLHARREQRGKDLGLPQDDGGVKETRAAAFPTVHTHTFSRGIHTNATQLLFYVHGSKCDDGPKPKYGVIAILPTMER